MPLEARIETLAEKKLIGQKLKMNLVNNRTGALWGQFMPRLGTIQNRLGSDKISMQIYDPGYFQNFNPALEFVKWAAVEVSDFEPLPDGMLPFTLPGGQYAVFDYKGSSADSRIFHYIFGTWLPQSGYQLDNRPHFEVLGEKYKNNDPDSEEEIWIPIKGK